MNRLDFAARFGASFGMGLPTQAVTLTAEQIAALNQKLSVLRHDINNNLGLLMAAVEMIQFKPDTAEKMLASISEQPPKITNAMAQFSAEFEKLFGITRP